MAKTTSEIRISILFLTVFLLSSATAFVVQTPPTTSTSIYKTCQYKSADRLNTSIQAINSEKGNNGISRKQALRTLFGSMSIPFAIVGTVLSAPTPASAKVSIKPDVAFQNLVKAREELNVASSMLMKKDYDGLRDYLKNEAVNMNNYDENANVLLASKQLDAESKVAIGTIRRYGVGADVIIMYGSVKAEISDDIDEEDVNYGAVNKSLKRTMDSLDEVIAICRSNGF